jgi:hypothetical protein
LGVGCDMHCGGGFICCGAAPGVEKSYKYMIYNIFICCGVWRYL